MALSNIVDTNKKSIRKEVENQIEEIERDGEY